MRDVLKDRLKESIGKEAKIILNNNYKYFGKITNCDERFVEILDYKTNSYKIIDLIEVKDVEVYGGNKGEENAI